MKPARSVRCAIYTRKSSDDGLEQAFNSLDAQREACAAYILSQANEGWTALPAIYDDGGLSGGTLERPALQRLLADVAAGGVDIIVVYKVDRLTRSLFDFAKLVELLDKAGTSFVSVTQSFNTTTSMGRLTLNMLLSFAQFEREVTAERIRDKIAASKARGMWMGGTPPLGYAPDGRTLAIVNDHAELIRHLFARYLALGNVRLVADELQRDGLNLPTRQRLNGSGVIGGGWFSRGQIYKILSNPIYIGRVAHNGMMHVGLHEAIVDAAVWEQTQAKLADNRQGARTRIRAANPSLLAGKVVDTEGQPLIASHASKGATRYRYYVSRSLNEGTSGQGTRIPAPELEAAVTEHVARMFDDALALAGSARLEITPSQIGQLGILGGDAAVQLRARKRDVVDRIIRQVRVCRGRIQIECDTAAMAAALQLGVASDAPVSIVCAVEVTLNRTGRAVRLIHGNGDTAGGGANSAVVRLLIRARRWWKLLGGGELNVTMLAAAEGVQPAYLTRVLRLAFLSPAVIEAILSGGVRAGIDTAALTTHNVISASWQQQERVLLPAGIIR